MFHTGIKINLQDSVGIGLSVRVHGWAYCVLCALYLLIVDVLVSEDAPSVALAQHAGTETVQAFTFALEQGLLV